MPWAHGWLALAGYLAVACIVLWPLPDRMSTHMLGDPFGDPLLNAWILGWDADEWFIVRCADTRILTGLDFLVERRSHSDYARRLANDLSTDGVSFATAWEGGVVAEMATSIARGDRPTTIRLEVPPVPFKVVRLRQTGQTPRNWFWSIDELQLRGR